MQIFEVKIVLTPKTFKGMFTWWTFPNSTCTYYAKF